MFCLFLFSDRTKHGVCKRKKKKKKKKMKKKKKKKKKRVSQPAKLVERLGLMAITTADA